MTTLAISDTLLIMNLMKRKAIEYAKANPNELEDTWFSVGDMDLNIWIDEYPDVPVLRCSAYHTKKDENDFVETDYSKDSIPVFAFMGDNTDAQETFKALLVDNERSNNVGTIEGLTKGERYEVLRVNKTKFETFYTIQNDCNETVSINKGKFLDIKHLSENPDLLEDIVITGIDRSDHPDFCDAFIESASFEGIPLLEENELDQLDTEECRCLVLKRIHDEALWT